MSSSHLIILANSDTNNPKSKNSSNLTENLEMGLKHSMKFPMKSQFPAISSIVFQVFPSFPWNIWNPIHSPDSPDPAEPCQAQATRSLQRHLRPPSRPRPRWRKRRQWRWRRMRRLVTVEGCGHGGYRHYRAGFGRFSWWQNRQTRQTPSGKVRKITEIVSFPIKNGDAP